MSEYRPLPPAARRLNEMAQILSSVSLILSLAVVGFIFFFGSEDTVGYRFDSKHGWAYLGDRTMPEDFEFRLLPNDLTARIDKGVVVQKRQGSVYLRPEPYYPFYSVIGSWFGFDRDAAVKGIVPSGSCARVNALTKTGFDSLWIHITIVDDAECGGPRPEPPPPVTDEPAEPPSEPAPETAPAEPAPATPPI
ncbi:MAG: hypothetical protein JNK21_12500 [Rhodospirillaceae bacterium]|nr:hypothetical protein [Rhodospirillaceae bacterium]